MSTHLSLPATSPWRGLFPIAQEPDLVYFNTAGEGPLCTVAEAALEQYRYVKTYPHKKVVREAFTVPKAIREAGAALIGADPAGCGLVGSTNYGINIVAQGYPWKPGDRVIVFEGEFPACVYPFMNLESQGVIVDYCPSPDGNPDYAALDTLITPTTRVIVASWVQFFNGFTHDLAHLKAVADRVGALVVVDASQGVGINVMDARALGLDAVTFSGHKTLCAPVGSGFFYLDPRHRDLIPVTYQGWLSNMPGEDFNDLIQYRMLENVDGRRWETGSDAQVVTLPFLAMLEWFLAQGPDKLQAHVRGITEALVEGLRARGCPVSPPDGYRSTICSFRPPAGADPSPTYNALREANVICSLRENWIRLSPHVYNDATDVERFFARCDAALGVVAVPAE
ncbi:MAG: aminotransferase class V-fold PLP-dependent enzyme [bacterium]